MVEPGDEGFLPPLAPFDFAVRRQAVPLLLAYSVTELAHALGACISTGLATGATVGGIHMLHLAAVHGAGMLVDASRRGAGSTLRLLDRRLAATDRLHLGLPSLNGGRLKLSLVATGGVAEVADALGAEFAHLEFLLGLAGFMFWR